MAEQREPSFDAEAEFARELAALCAGGADVDAGGEVQQQQQPAPAQHDDTTEAVPASLVALKAALSARERVAEALAASLAEAARITQQLPRAAEQQAAASVSAQPDVADDACVPPADSAGVSKCSSSSGVVDGAGAHGGSDCGTGVDGRDSSSSRSSISDGISCACSSGSGDGVDSGTVGDVPLEAFTVQPKQPELLPAAADAILPLLSSHDAQQAPAAAAPHADNATASLATEHALMAAEEEQQRQAMQAAWQLALEQQVSATFALHPIASCARRRGSVPCLC